MTENLLFDLKIKELTLLKKDFQIIDNNVIVLKDNGIIILGCRDCYMVSPTSTQSGYKIPAGNLVNFYEKLKEANNLPKEIAINCWMCPKCGRLFKELIPEFDISNGETNVSI